MDTLVENGYVIELASLIRRSEVLRRRRVTLRASFGHKLSVKHHQLRRAPVLRTSGEIGPAEAKRNGHGIRNGGSGRDTNPLEVVEMRIAVSRFLPASPPCVHRQ